MKKFLDNYILVFILFMPFLYLYISYGIKIKVDLELLGFILVSMFFIIIYIYLFLNNVKRNMLIGYIIFMLLAVASTFLSYTYSFDTIKFMLTILYLPIIILFFANYKNKWITQKYISYIYLIFSFALTISFIFKFNSELTLAYKQGFIGLFYCGSIIGPIMAVLMPIALDYAYKSNSYIVKGLFYICTIVSIIFVGTKTVYISLGMYLLYRLVKFFKKKPAAALIVATLLSSIVIVLPFIPAYQNFKNDFIQKVFKEDKSSITINTIDNILFHQKLNKTRVEVNTINNYNNRYKFILNNEYEPIGLDAADIFLTLGLVGTIFYVAFLIAILSSSKLKGLYKLVFVMMLIGAFFQGNILTSYLVYVFIGVLFLLTNEEEGKKKILLVSNMYPNKKYPSYGIFVKNTYDALLSKYDVDKVVIGKRNNILIKLIAYIYLHTRVILKMLFNDYEYIYVHFISHSSQGVCLASHFLRNVKIVFNAHGNDIVADNEKDEKNIIRSKKFLQYAYKVVVPSNYYKDVITDEFNVSPKNVVVYPSGGVDLNLFKKVDKKEAQKKLGLDTKTKYIGYVSRIEKDKGYDTFINGIKLLSDNKKYNKYKFIVVGDGNEYDTLNKLIADYELSERIILYKSLNRDELVYLYNSLDLFVFPTKRKSESLGLVGLEAMACEVPLVSSNAKGPMSYVNNKKNAYVFKQDDSNDLVNVIDKVINLEKEEIEKITKNAYKTALEYDSNKINSIIFKIFK